MIFVLCEKAYAIFSRLYFSNGRAVVTAVVRLFVVRLSRMYCG